MIILSAIYNSSCKESVEEKKSRKIINAKHAIVIHGGAGYYPAGQDSGMDLLYRQSLLHVIHIGDSLLGSGASGVDVVEKCISIMEDDSLFNAGRGSVLNEEGIVSMDASIMNGLDGKAGAVSGLTQTRNPIKLARLVMDSTAHVFLSGEGAEKFSESKGLEKMPPYWFISQKAIKAREDALKKLKEEKHGTVGCVVLDVYGNIVAGTSTGGMTMKKWGRIGDSPIIGAGTFADNASCGISCTGHGEYFIRNVVAYDVSARMKYLNEDITEAADKIIMVQLKNIDAKGGLVGLDKNGKVCMSFNTPTMFRAYKVKGEKAESFIN